MVMIRIWVVINFYLFTDIFTAMDIGAGQFKKRSAGAVQNEVFYVFMTHALLFSNFVIMNH